MELPLPVDVYNTSIIIGFVLKSKLLFFLCQFHIFLAHACYVMPFELVNKNS